MGMIELTADELAMIAYENTWRLTLPWPQDEDLEHFQLDLSKSAIRKDVGTFARLHAAARQDMTRLATMLNQGHLSAPQWYREMQIALNRNWYATFQAGKERPVTQAERRWLRHEFNRHDRFTRGFRDAIKRGELSEAQIEARAQMYAERLRGLYEAGRTAAHEIKLPQVPGDGKTICKVNCRCWLEFEDLHDDQGYLVAVNVYWRLTDAEACPDCIALAHEWNPRTERLR